MVFRSRIACASSQNPVIIVQSDVIALLFDLPNLKAAERLAGNCGFV
jgi:hypothetical protein